MMNIIEKAIHEKRTTLSEHESKEFLRACGIPMAREKEVHNEAEFIAAVREIGFPLVVKACSPDITHKTERNLVRVDIRTEDDATTAFREIMKETGEDGASVLVQEMVKGNRELVAGLVRDAQFGPCVMFGLGGIYTEILKDITFRVAPMDMPDTLDMFQGIRGRRILEASRGMPAVDIDKLADIIIRIGQIGVDYGCIREIDINPIIISGSDPIAVDALIVLNT